LKKTLVIAHRGASGYAPENTIVAFKKAIEVGSDGIELDVHFSKDRNLIVCHDERVDRTTNGVGFIKDLTLKELKKLDAGSWYNKKYKGEKIPILNEVFELVKDKNILINIEIKSGPIIYDGIEKAIVELIEKYNIVEKVIISSFNHYSLVKIKKINNNVKTGILYIAGLVEPWVYAKRLNAEAIHPFFYSVVPEIVKGCKDNGIEINPFTVDESTHIKRMIKLGVTGLITNYPDRAIEIINEV
jgi:glycerophosphoryl diester phosphodiesterase